MNIVYFKHYLGKQINTNLFIFRHVLFHLFVLLILYIRNINPIFTKQHLLL